MNKKIVKFLLIVGLLFCLITLPGCDIGGSTSIDSVVEKETYIVQFDSQGGDTVVAQFVQEGSVPSYPLTMKANYNFVGWFYQGEEWDFSTPITMDITLTAKWELIKYNVIFDNNLGSGYVDDLAFAPGVAFTIPENAKVTKHGYEFVGWVYQDKVYQVGDSVTINEKNDVTFVAKYAFNLTVTLMDSFDDKEIEKIETLEGSTVTLPTNKLTHESYSFIGWSKEKNGEVSYADGATFTIEEAANMTLYAIWEQTSFTVTFNSDGGSIIDDQVIAKNGKIVAKTPTKSGYDFMGWYYQDSLFDLTTPITSDITLVAKWEAKLVTIKFDKNNANATGAMSELVVELNKSIKLTKNSFTLTNYSFKGWSLSATGAATMLDEATLTVTKEEDITLYAVWEDNGAKIQELIANINKIGTVTYGSLETLQTLRKEVNSLSSSELAQVTNLSTLEQAEITLATIYIEVLENDTYAQTDITQARSVFDALENSLKDDIDKIIVLLEAEYSFDKQEKKANVNNNLQDVIKTIAYEFHYQGTQIQYDQSNSRRNLNATPESATTDKGIYLDCSSYSNGVYYYTFGQHIYKQSSTSTAYFDAYAKAYYGTSNDVIYYIETADYTTDEAKKQILTEVYNSLQVGDILTYRHGKSSGTSGHVMLYMGNGLFLHCTGTSTSVSVGSVSPSTFVDKTTTTEKEKGAVITLQASELFTNTSSSRYLFKSTTSDSVYSFSVIRMLNRSGLEVTEQALARYLLGNVTIEESVTQGLLTSVKAGATLSYKIVLNNKNSTAASNLYVEEPLDSDVEFVSASNNAIYNQKNHTIYWDVQSIASGASLTLTYQVKVKTDCQPGTLIDTNGEVCGIKLNSVENSVASNSDTSKVVTEATKLLGTTYENALDYVKAVYKNAWGKDILTTEEQASNILLKILSYYKLTETADPYPYLVKGAYGGMKYYDKNIIDNNCLKVVKPTYLQAGDIIVTHTSYNGGAYTCYIYLDSSTIISASTGTVTKDYTTSANVTSFLVTLCAYDRFVILRPSLVY